MCVRAYTTQDYTMKCAGIKTLYPYANTSNIDRHTGTLQYVFIRPSCMHFSSAAQRRVDRRDLLSKQNHFSQGEGRLSPDNATVHVI